MKLNSSNQNPSVAARALSAVSCQLSANLAPTEQEVALLEDAFGDAARGTAEISGGKNAIVGGWNAGTGLKAWLAEHCPEINYSTARRFLQVAEKTHAALSSGDSPVRPSATSWKARASGRC